MKSIYYFGIIIVCMIVLCVLLTISLQNVIFRDILEGYWKSDANFLGENNISLFTMAIGPCESSSCNIYMIMKDTDNVTILNEENKMTMISRSWNPFSKQKKYTILFDHEVGQNENDDIMPVKLNMIFEPVAGFFTLYDEDTIYAEMYRDNELSDVNTESFDSKPN